MFISIKLLSQYKSVIVRIMFSQPASHGVLSLTAPVQTVQTSHLLLGKLEAPELQVCLHPGWLGRLGQDRTVVLEGPPE